MTQETTTSPAGTPFQSVTVAPTEATLTFLKPMAAAGVGYTYKMLTAYVQYSHIFGETADNVNELFTTWNLLGTTSYWGMPELSVDTVKAGVALTIAI